MAEENNNTKKWLIWGCGGCLGLVVIVAIVGVVAGGACFSGLQKASTDTVHKVFGDSYEAPAGTIPIAIPMGEGNMVMLTNSSQALIAVEAPASEEQIKKMQSGDPQALEQMMAESAQSSGSSSLNIESQHAVTLPNGKIIPVGQGTIDKDGETHPAAMSLIPQKGNRMVVAIEMGLSATADPQKLEEELLKVINDSELDDRIP